MWQLQANCDETNTELFFSKLESKVAKAKALCGSCVVADKCLQFALDTEIEFGIFGGVTADERKALVSN
jgi:WhiB family redox-sensing transcriptional regulator